MRDRILDDQGESAMAFDDNASLIGKIKTWQLSQALRPSVSIDSIMLSSKGTHLIKSDFCINVHSRMQNIQVK